MPTTATEGRAQTDVTILGAGIVGVCCALSLQEKGLSVTIVDRSDPGEGASYGNAGVISPWSCVPQCMPGTWKQIPGWLLDPQAPVRVRWFDLPIVLPWAIKFLSNTRRDRVERISDAMDMLMRDNVAAYRRFLKGTSSEELVRDSWHVNVFRGESKPSLEGLAWKLRIDHGAPVEIVDGHELREIEPDVSPEYHSAVLVKDQARAFAPGELCKVLAQKAFQQGAVFLQRSVLDLTPRNDGGYVLVTEAGPLEAEKLVICGGAWSSKLLKRIGVKVPLMAERGYHLEFDDPGVRVNNSILDVAGKFIVSSMAGGIRAAGTAEFTNVDAPPNYHRAEILKPLTNRLLPKLNTGKTRRWMGIRPSFPDNLPVIGKVNGYSGLFAAFGHSHYGLGMAPATGRILADDVLGVPNNEDRSAIRIDRFL